LTPGENEKAMFGSWSDDKKSMIYLSNVRDPQFFDVYKMDIGKWEPQMIYRNDKGFQLEGISHDENLLMLSQPITTSENKLFLYNRAQDKMTEISKEKGSYSASGFSEDDRFLYYITDVGKEYAYLVEYNLESGETKTVYET
ncbi:S9 family peptidase, partial [Tamlana crocina]|nr:S9 family peptidase [Tamlana crocina]